MCDPSKLVIAPKPTRHEQRAMRFLIGLGLLTLIQFSWWFFQPSHIGSRFLYGLLTFSLVFKLFRMLHEWYHYFSIRVPQRPTSAYTYSVDILTTACPGEPYQMIIDTLVATQAITYPHTTYLCDEGNDPVLKQACERLGVIHVTRTEKIDAKAGNINHALRQATGEICVILDPDHIPRPEFLDRVLPYFENQQLGYVQVVQAYYNKRESVVAYGAAEQTYHFYGPMMMCMDHYGTVQAIGANCTFRRAALESIGGHAPGLAEDMHTAMRLHAKGWQCRYVPEIVSRGLVPATLAAYYKQQIKWSRGTFDLLATVYPRIISQLTWRQRLHYITLPLYYLSGLVGLIDLLIPTISLLTGQYPWTISLSEFLLRFFPVFGLSLLIRQYAQRWLLEDHEKGFHMVGGLLRTGTWWIHLMGFIYTLFKVRVPYIPTPKDDKPQNNFWLCLPNIVGIIASLGAIVYAEYYYGFHVDLWFTAFRKRALPPYYDYAFFMAFFASVNVFVLLFNVVIGQQKLLITLNHWVRLMIRKNRLKPMLGRLVVFSRRTQQGTYGLLRKQAIWLACLLVITVGGLLVLNNELISKNTMASINPDGPFLLGVYQPGVGDTINFGRIASLTKKLDTPFQIISYYEAWGPESVQSFPTKRIQAIIDQGAQPMITWEPWSSTFPQFSRHPELSQNRHIFRYISQGLFDDYLKQYAALIRAQPTHFYIRLAHEMDNPQYPWSMAGGNTPEEFINAWQYIIRYFKQAGVTNVYWVWNPWRETAISTYYPGSAYVDWVGITCLNYGLAAGDGEWHSFQTLYAPYRSSLFKHLDISIRSKPVMLAEFGSTHYGGNQEDWVENALKRLSDYPEIKSLVFFNSHTDANWATPWRPDLTTRFIDWSLDSTNSTLKSIRHQLQRRRSQIKKQD